MTITTEIETNKQVASGATKRSAMSHTLITPDECDCDRLSDIECPVCDWGLGICKICGAAESELNKECKGKTALLKQ